MAEFAEPICDSGPLHSVILRTTAGGMLKYVAPRSSALIIVTYRSLRRQELAKDSANVSSYDTQPHHRIVVHVVNSQVSFAAVAPAKALALKNPGLQMWESLTGVVLRASYIRKEHYTTSNIPWSSDYNEYPSLANVDPNSSPVSKNSIHLLRHTSDSLRSHRCSICGPSKRATCVYRPCGHFGCEACLDFSIECRHCGECGEEVVKFVGFEGSVEGRMEEGGRGAWTVMLEEDRVLELHGEEDSDE